MREVVGAVEDGPVKLRPKTSSLKGSMSLGLVFLVTSSLEASMSGSWDMDG